MDLKCACFENFRQCNNFVTNSIRARGLKAFQLWIPYKYVKHFLCYKFTNSKLFRRTCFKTEFKTFKIKKDRNLNFSSLFLMNSRFCNHKKEVARIKSMEFTKCLKFHTSIMEICFVHNIICRKNKFLPPHLASSLIIYANRTMMNDVQNVGKKKKK